MTSRHGPLQRGGGARDLEVRLVAEAARARSAPPEALCQRVLARLEPRPARSAARPSPRARWLAAAALVLLPVLCWMMLRREVEGVGGVERGARPADAAGAVGTAHRDPLLRDPRSSLAAALEQPLRAELSSLRRDVAGAGRFLGSRVPWTLLGSHPGGAGR